MATRKRALTRNITRKQARSYQKAVPNKQGVTTLSEVNGPGAYRRRYQATKDLLSAGGRTRARRNAKETSMRTYTAAQKRYLKKASPKQAKAFRKMLAKSPPIATLRKRKKASRKRARPNRALPPKGGAARKAYGRGYGRAFGKKAPAKRKAAKRAPAKAKRPTKAAFVASQQRKGRSPKQANAAWSLAYGKARKGIKAAQKRPQRRSYGKGKYRTLKARVGNTSRHTYLYRTKKGAIRHLPEHAVLGYPSARAMKLSRGTAAGEADGRSRVVDHIVTIFTPNELLPIDPDGLTSRQNDRIKGRVVRV